MTTFADSFNIPVPTEELNAKPSFLMPAGWYQSTLQAGAEIKSNDNGWSGIRLPFAGFVSKKDSTTFEKDRNYQITIAGSDKAVAIGRKQLVAAAAAFGLTEDTVDDNGKPAKRLTATSPEELVEQFNGVAGSPCDVYVTTKKRTRGKEVVMRDDGNGPVMDNEISAVAAFGEGK
jgi:hypothetical protein